MEIRGDVVAHQGEEAGDGKRLVAVSQNLEVYGFLVVKVAEEGDDGVDGYHDEYSNDTAFVSTVVHRSCVNKPTYCFCS